MGSRTLYGNGLSALFLVTLFTACDCGTPADTFDATPPRSDTGFVPVDSGAADSRLTYDTYVNQPDTNVNPDTAAPDNFSVLPDNYSAPDTNVVSNDGAPSGDAAVVPVDGAVGPDTGTQTPDAGADGRGQQCTQGSCPAPYTCAIPQGYTEGICLELCTPGTCTGRSQVCDSLGSSFPNTYCLDVVQRGGSCLGIYSRCAEGTDCYITDEDADGTPTEALCKKTCTVDQTGTCEVTEQCVSSGYVNVEQDQDGNYVTCDTNPNICSQGYTCTPLRTGDGRTLEACAEKLGWCGVVGSIGDVCNEDQDQYCGDLTDPATDPAMGICAEHCWYICFIPGALSSSGQDVTLGCPSGIGCVDTPEGLFPEGVRVCEPGFDAGSFVDAAVPDVILPDVVGADLVRPDAGMPDSALPDVGFDAGVEDARVEDAGCLPCNGLTFIGECQDNILRWCHNGCLRTTDCSANSDLHCAEFNPTWGFDCLAGAGQQCNPDYPDAPSNPNAPRTPGCDPSVGVCNEATFTCLTPVPDAGSPDATSDDAGSTCYPCGSVDQLGICVSGGDILAWCDNNGCLAALDCADTRIGRHCSYDPQTSWYDCMGGIGQSCDPDFYRNMSLGNFLDWMCDPLTTSGCSTVSNTCQ